MNKPITTLIAGAALCAAVAVPAALARHQAGDAIKDAARQTGQAVKDAAQEVKDAVMGKMGEDEARAMAAWMDYMSPGEHHAHLKAFEGQWDLKIVWWQHPGAEATESKATSSARLIMDGRFLIENVKGAMNMGEGMEPMPFEGMAMMGYDNSKKKYFSHWIDNMATGCMTEWGTCEDGGRVMNFEGMSFNPMFGEDMKSRSRVTIVDDNTRRLEMWGPAPDRTPFKMMEITYTRR